MTYQLTIHKGKAQLAPVSQAEKSKTMTARKGDAPLVEATKKIAACRFKGDWQSARCAFESLRTREIQPDIGVYGALLGVYEVAGKTDLCAGILREMKSSGISQTVWVYNNRLEGAFKRKDLQRAMALKAEMERAQVGPSAYTYTLMINGLMRVGAHADALKMFEAFEKSRLVADAITYNSALKLFGVMGLTDRAFELFGRMQREQKADRYTYNTMIWVANQAGRYREALEIFEEIRKQGLTWNSTSISTVAQTAIGLKDVRLLRDVERRAQENGFKFDEISYSAFIKAADELGESQEALRYYQLMQEAKISMNDQTLTIVWDAMLHAHAFEGIQALYRDFKSEGRKFSHSNYDVLMRTADERRNFQEVLRLSEEMEQQGVKKDLRTFNILIQAAGNAERYDAAKQFLREMQEKGFQPDHYSYGPMIHAAGREQDQKEVIFFVKKMRRIISQPDLASYNNMLQALAEVGVEDLFEELQEEMSHRGLVPDQYTYAARLLHAMKRDRFEEVDALLKEMQVRNISRGAQTYNLLIKQSNDKGDYERALGYYARLLSDDRKPNDYTFNNLIHAADISGRTEEVEHFFSEMQKRGIEPDAVTYGTRMKIHCSQGKYDEAVRLFESMIEKGIVPNECVYHILIKGALDHGREEDALGFYRDMRDRGVKPTIFAFHYLMRVYWVLRRPQEGIGLIEEMRQVGLSPNEVTRAHLCDLYVELGDFEKARALLRGSRGEERNVVDCHEISYGQAFMEVWHRIHEDPELSALTLITGRGKHSSGPTAARMKPYMKQKIAQYFKEWEVIEDSRNEGMFTLRRMQKESVSGKFEVEASSSDSEEEVEEIAEPVKSGKPSSSKSSQVRKKIPAKKKKQPKRPKRQEKPAAKIDNSWGAWFSWMGSWFTFWK